MKYLIAVDDDEVSWDAVEFARRIVRPEDDIVVVNVAEPTYRYWAPAAGLTGVSAAAVDVGLEVEAATERARVTLDRAVAALPGRVEPRVEFGSPAEEICHAAEEEEADIIILGTHDRGALKRIFGGSVSDDVVHKAPCPVLVVR